MAVAAYLIPYNLFTISPRSGGGVGIKIFAIMLICNMIMCEKVEFRPFDPKRGREGGRHRVKYLPRDGGEWFYV